MLESALQLWLEVVIVSLVQGSFAVAVVHLAMRSTRVMPAVRHRVLLYTLYGLFAMPVLFALVPRAARALEQQWTSYATSSHASEAASRRETAQIHFRSSDPEIAGPSRASVATRSTLTVPHAAPSVDAAANAATPSFPVPRVAHVGAASGRVIAGVAAFITFVLLMRLAVALVALRRVVAGSTAPDALLLQRLEPFMDRDRALFIVRVSTGLRTPAAVGLRRTWIVLPAVMVDQLSDTELEHVVLHELAHVERRDSAANFTQQILVTFMWYNPVAWWISRRVVIEREMACDAAVVQHTRDARAYARSLVRVAEMTWNAPQLALGSAIVTRSGLSRRVECLMSGAATLSHAARVFAACSAVVVLLVAASFPRMQVEIAPNTPLASPPGYAHDANAGETDKAIAQRIDNTLRLYAANGFSGVVLVAHNGRVLLRQGYGEADRERGIRMTPGTYFSTAGMTKALTATDAALLEHDGLLRMGDPIARFVEPLRAKPDVTIHQLLTHTDGVARAGANVASSDRDEFVRAMRSTPIAYRAGTATRYTDVGYSLLGVAIENVTGRTFEDFTRDRVLVPIGMTASRFEGESLPPGAVLAREYAGPVDEQKKVGDRDYVWGRRASLGLVTTADDLYRLLNATENASALPDNVRARVLTPNTRTGANNAEGYGWETIDTWYGTRVHRRLAGTPGFEGELLHDLDDGWDAVILVNSAVGWRYAIWSEIALAFRGRPSAPIQQVLARRRYAPYQGGRVSPLPAAPQP